MYELLKEKSCFSICFCWRLCGWNLLCEIETRRWFAAFRGRLDFEIRIRWFFYEKISFQNTSNFSWFLNIIVSHKFWTKRSSLITVCVDWHQSRGNRRPWAKSWAWRFVINNLWEWQLGFFPTFILMSRSRWCLVTVKKKHVWRGHVTSENPVGWEDVVF